MPAPPVPPLARTLILDYRDSYTNNLLSLFVSLYPDDEVKRKVVVVQADEVNWTELQTMLEDIDCIVLSPGPGRPDIPSDIGFALDLIRSTPLPLLGICLGMQSLAVAYGGKIINTPDLKHGHVIPIAHSGKGIFDLLPTASSTIVSISETSGDVIGNGKAPFESLLENRAGRDGRVQGGSVDMVTYNSLTVDDEDGFPKDELEVIAWHDDQQTLSNGDKKPVRTVQGLAHIKKPQWGVQFHPESIASSSGNLILLSFLLKTHAYHSSRQSYPPLTRRTLRMSSTFRQVEESRAASRAASPGPGQRREVRKQVLRVKQERLNVSTDAGEEVVFEKTCRQKEDGLGSIWLDGVSNRAVTTSSMALPKFLLSYSLQNRTVTCHHSHPSTSKIETSRMKLSTHDTFWKWFARGSETLHSRLAQGPNERARAFDESLGRVALLRTDPTPRTPRPAETRWRGGWVGWWGYEMKEESLGGYTRKSSEEEVKVDACWGWCDQILQKGKDGSWSVCGVLEETKEEARSADTPDAGTDMVEWLEGLGLRFGCQPEEFNDWLRSTETTISATNKQTYPTISRDVKLPFIQPKISAEHYMKGIQNCRDEIFAGNSYELTLINQFTATLPADSAPSSFDLYVQLRKRNPAPYSGYLHFPTVGNTILSSSPERLIRIDGEGRVEMKPIKGTRGRIRCVCARSTDCLGGGGPGCKARCEEMDRQVGEELRMDGKERAENLMIVDLIRSDLQSCCTPSSVQVPKLIALETYESVHQLVTTVVGRLEPGISEIEAIERCFPPGSMTGAPKLRSVQILDHLEHPHERRGIYSGALGYMSIDGDVDLSVVIRTIIVETTPAGQEDLGGMQEVSYTLGAGGAITWLSKADGEWEEVLTKVGSVIGRQKV